MANLEDVLFVILCVFVGQSSAIGTILVNPKSILVPIGVEVTFKCKIQGGYNSHWNINDQMVIYRDTITMMQEEGFFITKQTVDNTDTLSLRVNATASKNGTRIFCSSLFTHSDVATLIILTENPLSQNPFIENPNATSILLKWSPPYLWPGKAIEYYNVSISGAQNKEFHRVNTSFSDPYVSFLKTADQDSEDTQTCSVLLLSISAASSNSHELPLFSVIGGYLPSNRSHSSFDVHPTTLFRFDRSPFVMVEIVFPQTICDYERINYSINIEDINIKTQHHYGPYQHYGSAAKSHTIASGLEEDKEYTLIVVVNTRTGDILSQRYNFNTSLQCPGPVPRVPCIADADPLNTTDLDTICGRPFNNGVEKTSGRTTFVVLIGVKLSLLLILL